ncbi:uncharacterized protein LOC131211271 [Anopheles bellator]|uniref:uncharacterized protein LOC131211271 n=1 Tax=Anopheles bellator TaxID=139047 RepID=UPI0026474BF2|nr:uncharacterized protein LOC131211271 [Anopheles bellator]
MKLLLIAGLLGILASIALPATCSPLFRGNILSGRAEKPLLALSLESSETLPDVAPVSSEKMPHDDGNGFQRPGYRHKRPPTTTTANSQRFYGVVLSVLQLLESQARQEVQRARVQHALAQHSLDDDDDDDDTEEVA